MRIVGWVFVCWGDRRPVRTAATRWRCRAHLQRLAVRPRVVHSRPWDRLPGGLPERHLLRPSRESSPEPPLESAMVTPDELALDAAHPRKHHPPMTRPTTAVPCPKAPVQPPDRPCCAWCARPPLHCPRCAVSTRAILTDHGLTTDWPAGVCSVTPQAGDCDWAADQYKFTTQALVAQGIEHRFPKPCVAGSIPAGGTRSER